MLYVALTFDYELFMGENYVSEEEVLIKPTENLAKMLHELGVSGTFFADVCCPIRYREKGQYDFPKLFDEQIQWLIKNGQDVQLHIHSNWVGASEIGRKVVFDSESYRLHNWDKGNQKGNVFKIITNGMDYLNNIILPINSAYKCIAYRAGGYCLQPEQDLIPLLYQAGIRIDSSVCRGMYYDGDGMYYDYRDVPHSNNVYLNDTFGLKDEKTCDIKDGVFEVPVGGYSTFPYRLLASKMNKKITCEAPRGCGMALTKKTNVIDYNFIERVKQARNSTNMLTFDSYYKNSIIYMLNRMAKEEGRNKKDVFVATIAHPKCMSEQHIQNMRESIIAIKKNKCITFVNMQEIAQLLNL